MVYPDRKDDVLLMDAELAKSCSMSYFVHDLAAAFQDVMDREEGSYGFGAVHNDWFQMSGPTSPKRRGYCLGLEAVRYLSRQNRVETMVTWDQTKFKEELKKAFGAMSSRSLP